MNDSRERFEVSGDRIIENVWHPQGGYMHRELSSRDKALMKYAERQALERAIAAAEHVASKYHAHKAAHPHVQGMQAGTAECVHALRALLEAPSSSEKEIGNE